METKILLTQYQDKPVMLVYEADKLVDIVFRDACSTVGNIYVGKVKNIVPNINAAFVELEDGLLTYYSMADEKPIFLNNKKNDKLTIGDDILVQIVKDGIKTKAPQVSSKLTLTGKYLVLTLEAGQFGISNKIKDSEQKKSLKGMIKKNISPSYGAIIRTNATEAGEDDIIRELTSLEESMTSILKYAKYRTTGYCLYQMEAGFSKEILGYCNSSLASIITDDEVTYHSLRDYFSMYDPAIMDKLTLYQDDSYSLSAMYNIHRDLERATNKRVWLKSGAYLVIEQTEAMVVIDVNTGKSIGKQDKDKHFLDINLEAAKECAKQIRLRNLSGIIIIDFINMDSVEHKNMLIQSLKEHLAKDRIKTNYVDTTALGLVEITRKKERKSVKEVLEG